MKVKRLSLFVCCLFLLNFLVGCGVLDDRPSEATMPYSSEDYESESWSVESLVEHFKSLGFYDIKTDVNETIHKEDVGIETVEIEIYPSDSWFTEYRRITKGDTYETHRKIHIKATTYVSTITIDNSQEFAEVVSETKDNAYDALQRFLENHEGEYIEFAATVVRNGRPPSTSKGMYVWFAIEHGNAILYKNGVSVSDLGTIEGGSYGAGAKVHILGIVKKSDIKILLMTVTEPKEVVSEQTNDNSKTEPNTTSTEETINTEPTKQNYILNKSTKKFHRTHCRYISKIKEANKLDFHGIREDLIAKGYSPCDSCNP